MEATRPIPVDPLVDAATHNSAVAWGAVLAGAAAACALSLILAFLGLGFGMSAISPWAGSGASATTLSVGAILWITLTQIAAAAIGGYLAGRLRVRWPGTAREEVYFRDTAHGFLAWAVATLVVALCFTTTLGNVMKAGAAFSGAAVQGAGAAMAGNMPGPRPHESREGMDYAIDVLLRRPAPAADINATEPPAPDAAPTPERGRDGNRGEIARIYERAMQTGTLADADAKYLASMIAQRGGISEAEAETRVKQAYADLQAAAQAAKETADKARKAAAYTSLWLFIALLAGAFFASLAATFGGSQRDYDPPRR
jgi:hypothetical protein